MNAQHLEQEWSQEPPAAAPGARLRRAREAKGLDLERTAQLLHLKPPAVAALEADDYAALPGPVFVRGYVRNYARLLGLDEESLLRDLATNTAPAVATPPRVRAQPRKEIHSSHLAVRLVSWVIVLSVAGLVYTWWQNPGNLGEFLGLGIKGAISPPAADAPAVSSEGRVAPLPPTGSATPPASKSEPAAVQPKPEPVPAQAKPVAPPLPPEARPAERAVAGAPAAGPAADSIPAPATPPPLDQEQEVTEAPEAPPQSAVEEGVVFEFTGTCWVDIRDSSLEFKLMGEMYKGDRHVLGGTPPYTVVVGNASAVEVTVNGQPFDVARLARGNVARFKLDPDTVD